MTNSTDSNAQKSPKVKGPIRTEAVIPIAIIAVLGLLYFKFFFDNHLRRAIEWTATYVHGAEVNVGSVNTSFFGGSFRLSDLQVTDKTEPSRNLFSLGEIRFRFSWDALLRLKFVVEDAGIETIQVYGPRRRPGWVKPPEPPSPSASPVAKLEENILAQTREQFSGNVLGDLAQLLEGQDEKEILKQIQSELKAEKHIKELQASLKEKEKEWKERLEKLPRKEEFDALAKRAEELKFNTKDPKGFARDLKAARDIIKEADAKIDALKAAGKNLGDDVENFNREIRQIDDLIKKDIDDIENRLKIGKIDYADFSKDLFGRMFSSHLVTLNKYAGVAKQYMPPQKDPSEKNAERIVPRQRGAGEDIRFPVKGGYPLFWLRRATVSSKSTEQGLSGDVKGEITDVSTDPAIVSNPTLVRLEGDFPKQDIYGFKFLATLDHRTAPSKQTVEASVASYPVTNVKLSDGSDARLTLTKATGSSNLNAILQDMRLTVELRNRFENAQYDIQAKSKILNEALTSILAGIPVVTVNARAMGSWNDLDLNINSNLGKELAAGLKRFVKEKVDGLKQKVRELVNSRIKGERDKLTSEYSKLKGQVDDVVNKRRAEVEKAKDQIESRSKAKQKSTNDDLKQKGKDLLKKLKF